MAAEIKYRKLSELNKLQGNPRQIKSESFKSLCQSIKDNPDYFEARPVILSNRTGEMVILAGNQRYEAAKSLKMAEIPTILLPGLTEEREREIIIRDNVANGEWDFEILANEWDQNLLLDWGVPLPDDFGIQPEASEDDYEMPDEIETDIVLGDLFQIGNHRLLCGDSTDPEQVKRLMGGALADMVFTDPPYGVSYEDTNAAKSSRSRSRSRSEISGDKMNVKEISEAIWRPAFKNLYESSKDDCSFYMTMCQGGDQMMMMMMMSEHWQVKHELIWVKSSPVFSMGRLDYDYKHEPIIYGWKKKHNFYGKGEFVKSVWEIPKPSRSDEHPTMKPVALIANAINNSSKASDLIIDLFLGSGTTMIASHQLNRKCYGMELDPKYCQVIIDRMKKLEPLIEVKKINN